MLVARAQTVNIFFYLDLHFVAFVPDAHAVVQVREGAVVWVEERVRHFLVLDGIGGEWTVGAIFVNGVNDSLRCGEGHWMFVVNEYSESHVVSAQGGCINACIGPSGLVFRGTPFREFQRHEPDLLNIGFQVQVVQIWHDVFHVLDQALQIAFGFIHLHFSLFFSIHETHVEPKGDVRCSHCSFGKAMIVLLSAPISFQFFFKFTEIPGSRRPWMRGGHPAAIKTK